MAQNPQNNNTILIVVAIIGFVGVIAAATIQAVVSNNNAKLSHAIELTRIALASIPQQGEILQATLASTISAPISTPVTNSPTQNIPKPTNSPSPTIDSDPSVYDNFNNPAFDGNWNTGLWGIPHALTQNTIVEQKDGVLKLSRKNLYDDGLLSIKKWRIEEIGVVEAKVKLDSRTEASFGSVAIEIDGTISGTWWWMGCSIGTKDKNSAQIGCNTKDGYSSISYTVPYNTWHSIRIETNPDTALMTFYADDSQIGTYVHPNPEAFKKTFFGTQLFPWSKDGGLAIGYIDYVRIWTK